MYAIYTRDREKKCSTWVKGIERFNSIEEAQTEVDKKKGRDGVKITIKVGLI